MIETVPLFGIVGPVDTVCVELTGTHVGQVAVPDFVGIFGQRYALDLVFALAVEQAQFHPFGMSREQGEIRSGAVPGRSQRIGQARPHPPTLFHDTTARQ
jgi:hypothetical protein